MNTETLSLKEVQNIYGERITFGEALKSERQSRDMSRREFCMLLNISIQSLADLEHGRRIPSPERTVKIAEQLNEPLAYWIQLSFQDQLAAKDIQLEVTVA